MAVNLADNFSQETFSEGVQHHDVNRRNIGERAGRGNPIWKSEDLRKDQSAKSPKWRSPTRAEFELGSEETVSRPFRAVQASSCPLQSPRTRVRLR